MAGKRKPKTDAPKETRPKPGRPSTISDVVGYRPAPDGTEGDGSPIYAWQRIVSGLEIGQFFYEACAAAGVPKDTAAGWRRRGRQLRDEWWRDEEPFVPAGTSDDDIHCVQFSIAADAADARFEQAGLTVLSRLSRFGRKRTKTVETTKRVAGVPVEETVATTEEEVDPDPRVVMWLLGHKFKERWGNSMDVQVSQPEGEAFRVVNQPTDTKAIAELREVLERAQVIKPRAPKPEEEQPTEGE